MSISDRQLLEAVKTGNQQVVERYYLDVHAEFIHWCYKQFALDREQALDAFQDAFVIFYEKLCRGTIPDIKSSLKTYLFAIGKHLIYRRFQKADIRQRNQEQMAYLSEDRFAPAFLEEEEQVQMEQIALEAARTMKEPCRSILQWFYFDRLSLTDIAQKLGYKNDNVMKNKKARCLQKLRKTVEKRLKNYFMD